MTEIELHRWAVLTELALAPITALVLAFVVAPYGRHTRPGWGPTIPSRLGWFVMELPAVALFAVFFLTGAHRFELVPLILFGLWQLHYLNRTILFPLRMRTARRMPLVIPALAIAFNVLNAYVNARWIGHLGQYTAEWITDPRFLVGAALFVVGWVGNLHADAVLRRLRTPADDTYRIPHGGMFRWVSTPNYLFEIVEWIGWAVATWSTAGLAFAVYTAANLAPRALSHHAWYREHFPDYPAERRALIPYVL